MRKRLKAKRTLLPLVLIVIVLTLVIASKAPGGDQSVKAVKSELSSSASTAQSISFRIISKAAPIVLFKKIEKTSQKDTFTSDNAESEKNGALIVFTFDDGNESDCLLAYPILSKYGISGTSYINPYDADHNVKNKLSWLQIKQMESTGWEFGDHTYRHMDLTKSTPEQIEKSMSEVDAAFLRNGLGKPAIFAYPYGKFDDNSLEIVKRYRKQARLAFYDDVFADSTDFYRISSISADMQKEDRLKSREKLVDKACRQGLVIVFRVHCLYREEPGDTGKQVVMTDSKLFKKLVDYCVEKGCYFSTMGELIKNS